jgi:hypothetical protein
MTRTLVFAAFAAFAFAPIVAAAAPEMITNGNARWTTDGKVELSFTYQGGACEMPGEASVAAGDATDSSDEVTVPTVSTAEVCTMQIVPVEFSGIIPVEPTTRRLVITVLAPDGTPKAAGSIVIEKGATS